MTTYTYGDGDAGIDYNRRCVHLDDYLSAHAITHLYPITAAYGNDIHATYSAHPDKHVDFWPFIPDEDMDNEPIWDALWTELNDLAAHITERV